MTLVRLVLQELSDVPADDEWLSSRERERVSLLRVEKRRLDWRLGRWTAKQAVLAIGPPGPLSCLEILAGQSGAPELLRDGSFDPVPLSISHSSGRGLCAVANGAEAVGCDLELVEARSSAFAADYFTPGELSFLSLVPETDRSLFTTLIWSAKESVLKAVRAGLRFSTTAVSIVPEGAGEEPVWQTFFALGPGPRAAFRGWWRRDGRFVLTVTAKPDPGEPVMLTAPFPRETPLVAERGTGSPVV